MANNECDKTSKQEDVNSVIGELCLLAPTDDIKRCIKTYQYGKDLDRLRKDFNGFTKSILEDTLSFLQVPDQKDYLKPSNIHNLICRIQNLLPERCSICNESYCVRLEDNPLLQCVMCGQDVHRQCFLLQLGAVDPNMDSDSLLSIINPHNIKNLYYLCDHCANENLPKSEAGKKKNKRQRDLNNLVKPIPIAGKQDDKMSDPILSDKDNSESIETIDKISDKSTDQNRQISKTCAHYLKGKCKYGIKGRNCKFDHPKACRKFMKHGTRARVGCQKGRNCLFFHPKMCFDSLRKGECFNKMCQLTHVKGTKRNAETYPQREREYQNKRDVKENQYQNDFKEQHYHHDIREYGSQETHQRNNQNTNKEMDFLAIFQKFKKDLMLEIDQKISTLMDKQVRKEIPLQYQYPQQMMSPQNNNWGINPSMINPSR